MQLRGEGFRTLARAIVGQQISTKAADSVWKKFVFSAVGKVTPKNVANAPYEVLRPCGLSDRKVIYMHALAKSIFSRIRRPSLTGRKSSDDEIIKELTSVKGIGRWTAEMFLMFSLGRPDVFPTLDLGLLKGIYRHYNKSEKMTKAEVMAIGERWKPWRTLGTWYMWRALDPVPVAY